MELLQEKSRNLNYSIEISNPITFRDNLFQSFVEYADVTETTLNGYKTNLRRFIEWKQAQGIRNPTRADIKAYKDYLTGEGLKAGTQRQYLQAVKLFFKWTSSEGIYPNIADNIKAPKIRRDIQKKDSFEENDIKAILESIDDTSEAGARDKCILLLCVTQALRIIEIQRANIEDIKTIAGEKVLFIQGKGRTEKDEYKKIIPEIWEPVRKYLETYRQGAKKSEPLFVGTSNRAKGCRISEPGISRLLKSIFRNAGYDSDRLTAHSLRHTGVTMLLKDGATIQEAQAYARHSDPATTCIYAHNLDRAKDRSEQRVYDRIFQKESGKRELLEEIERQTADLSPEELKEVIETIKHIKERKEEDEH